MISPGYLRHPTLRGQTIVFVCDDDLWTVDAAGGVARRLTAGLGEPSHPALSPCGQWLAYVGRDETHPEVFLMPAAGGPSRRMTWLGPDVMVRGFTPDGRILFVTTHGQPFFRNYRAFAQHIDGGLPELLPYGMAHHLAFGTDNAVVIGRNTGDPARWKRYRGGTAGHLWIDAAGRGEFRRMSELAGNITTPMWLGDRVYYLSDREGYGNLYSCRPDGGDERRHTDHSPLYARHAQTDGARIVYQCGAEIWLYDPARETTERLDISVPAHRAQTARRFVSAIKHRDDLAIHPSGHSIAVTARGKLFHLALWEGAVRQAGSSDGARYRHGQWLADGKSLVATSDRVGEERLVVFSADGAQSEIDVDIGRVTDLVASPVSEQVALANHRNEILLADLASSTIRVLDHSAFGNSGEIAWSPDGAWIAYTFRTSPRHTAIKLCEIATGRCALVTTPEFNDFCPSFDPGGKYLYFLSFRTFDPVYDTLQFELSFPRGSRPYLIALTSCDRPPFDPMPRGLGDGEQRKDKPKDKPVVRVDLEGIVRRVAAFPVPEGIYRQIAGIDGKVLWTVFSVSGAHGRGGHQDPSGRLEQFDLETVRCETIAEKADQFLVSADGQTLLVSAGEQLRALEAGAAPEDADEDSSAYSRETGRIDLGRIRVSVEPRLEWRQMLREVWRLQRDQFWVADMSGVDWNAVWSTYEPLLERVATRGELSDLIWEMQGELGTSHAYEYDGDHRKPPPRPLGMLAADLSYDEGSGGYRIEHIVAGDPWEASADSPLGAIGVDACEGEVILAVNGQPVSKQLPPQALLVHQAAEKAELLLSGRDGARRTVLVTLLRDDIPARYREWVEGNRRIVHERSAGAVGYLHLPDMMSAGFAEFHRYFTAECDREALIVDVRYNRGGHVSQLLLEKLARRRLGYDMQRWGMPMPYPSESPAGPLVALTNEHAGSDGDIFSHCFKLMNIGPLVGKRTWGGVIGISPRHSLVDGSTTTQPEFSFWFADVGWTVENYGTDPDVDVENTPQDMADGHDKQLEVALGLAIERIGTTPSLKPVFSERPRLAPGPLGSREHR